MSISSQRSSSLGHGRFVFRNEGLENQGHHTTTSGLRSRIFITQNRGQQPQPRALEDAAHTFSEVSLSHPAIISQSSAVVTAAQHQQQAEAAETQQLLPEQEGLPAIFVKLFMARQKDLQLSRNIELQLQRFSQLVFDQSLNKLQMREQGFGAFSAKVLAKIIRESDSLTSLDLSLNNLDKGMEKLVGGIIDNQSLVSVTLKNNSIDGRRFQQEIFDMVYEHRSLASLNLGNT